MGQVYSRVQFDNGHVRSTVQFVTGPDYSTVSTCVTGPRAMNWPHNNLLQSPVHLGSISLCAGKMLFKVEPFDPLSSWGNFFEYELAVGLRI